MPKTVKFNIQLNIDGKRQIVTASTDAKELANQLGIAKTKGDALRGSLLSFGALQMTFMSLQNGLQSITGVLNGLTEESRAYVSAMKAANTMAGKDAAGFEQLKDQVAELSKTIPIARDQLANGLYQVISNGVPEDNWISYLEASSRSAVGGIADVGEVVKVTSTVIKNYGLEWSAAQDIQDKIQLTAKNGVTSFEQLAAALPSVTGQAAQLGVSFTEMLAVMSTLTGVTGNTSEVATQLGSVLTALTKESSKSQKMAEAMGVSFNAASIKAAGGLHQYLQELDRAVTAYAQKTGTLKESIYSQLFGRAEALRLVNALTGNLSEKFSENINALDNSIGTIDSAFDEMASTGAAKMQMLRNAWGGLIDHIQGAVGAISPILNFTAQVGMTAMAVMSLGKAFAFVNVSAKAAVIATYAQAAASKVSAATTKLYASAQLFANRMQIAWTFGAKAFVIQTVAMRVALAGVIGLGIAAVFVGAAAALRRLTGETDIAAAKARGLADAAETMKSAEEAGTRAAAEAKTAIDAEVKKLDDLIKSKGDASQAVSALNEKYGQWFGHCKTAQEWYDKLIGKSQQYCLQLGYEAQMRVYNEKKAQLEIEKLRNEREQKELKQRGGDVGVTSVGGGNFGVTQTVTVKSEEQKKLEQQSAQINSSLGEINKNIEATQTLMERNGVALTAAVPEVDTTKFAPVGGSATTKKGKTGNTKGDPNKDKIIEGAKSYADLTHNIGVYKKQLEAADPANKQLITSLRQQIAEAEAAAQAAKDLASGWDLQNPDTLEEIDEAISRQQALRKKDNAENLQGIDAEIKRLQGLKAQMERNAKVPTPIEQIHTYEQLDEALAIYNDRLKVATEEERAQIQTQIIELEKLREKWDATLEAMKKPGPIGTLKTVEDLDYAISYYGQLQKRQSADEIAATQQVIQALEAKKKAMERPIELAGMQKEIDEINALSGREFKVKIKDMGFDALTDKIRELKKALNDIDNPPTENQRKQIEGLIATYEEWRRKSISAFDNIKDGYSAIRGIGDGIHTITDAVRGNGDAWQQTTAVVSSALQIYEGVMSVIELMRTLGIISSTAATQTAKAKTEEAAATTAATTAAAAQAVAAPEQIMAETAVTAATKVAAQAQLQLAAAGYAAAHASIPFAGFGIAAGFAAAAQALVQAMGAIPLASGGVVSGPTLALVGEYAGASNNPEVVAPLDKLRSMMQPAGSVGGNVRFEIEGRKLVGVLGNETTISGKSGRRNNF